MIDRALNTSLITAYLTQPAITCSKLTIETLEKSAKFAQS